MIVLNVLRKYCLFQLNFFGIFHNACWNDVNKTQHNSSSINSEHVIFVFNGCNSFAFVYIFIYTYIFIYNLNFTLEITISLDYNNDFYYHLSQLTEKIRTILEHV